MPHSDQTYQTLRFRQAGGVARITMNRPAVHNAFNEVMISEMDGLFGRLAGDDSVRVVVLAGSGKSFCAGADIHWMKRVADFSYEENLEDNLALSRLFRRMYSMPLPTLARVHGAAIGGGAGMAAVCDIVVASQSAIFSLSEVRLGLLPACAVPYLLRRVGETRARELMLMGERISSQEALRIGLANAAVPDENLDEEIDLRVERVLAAGPRALAACKLLVEAVSGMELDEAGPLSAEALARLRVGKEGQEGMRAFLEKRRPDWTAKGDA